ncbi:MAG TPA: hypothetical protein VHF47_03705 [Acidimicrobiales bacterium]|nr:hypothetical protein [Acidimicrobiales bacterium]
MRIVACLAVLTLVLPAAQAQQASSPLAAVQEVLDRRTAAVAGGDRAAFLATVDPQAPPAFREAQARSFDGLRSVPITGYRLAARVDDSGDLAPEPDRFLPETRATYRIEGYDDRDAVDTLWLTFVQRDGRWYVGADGEVAAVGLDTARNLWDYGPVRLLRTEHFLVLSHPDKAGRADELAAMAEEAHATFSKAWSQPWSGRIPMIVPSSTDQLEEMLQSTVDLDKFVAFVSYGFVRDVDFVATAPRLFVQDATFSRNSRRYQVETLVHELVHVATAASTGPFTPAWLHEGLAEWLARGRTSTARAPAGGDGTAPRTHEFATGSQDDIVRAYAEARTLTAALARRGSPVDVFRTLGEVRVAAGDEDHHVDRVLRRVVGIGTLELESQWRGSG